ncbi:MAG: hypothetical protein HY784_08095 [Chloroflexi bacterium]|nr:hypothetical protein [Chloroflexota bacterium]
MRRTPPLHVGSGALADSLADKPLLKNADGLPLVPGSAVRGKARHACEQIFRGLAGDWPGCLPPYQFCTDHNRLCPVCRMFGSETWPGEIRFGDLRLEFVPNLAVVEKEKTLARAGRTALRWSVSLNRYRGTAEADLLYNVETHSANPAVAYRGVVRGNLSGETLPQQRAQAALLVAGLRAVRSLGGGRTRGLGWGQFDLTVRLDGEVAAAETLLKEVGGWSA